MKKLLAFFLAAVMLISCLGICVGAEDEPKLGDLNRDGKFNLTDVVKLLQYIAGWDLGDPEFYEAVSDINKDGRINLNDVSYYLRWLADSSMRVHVPTREYYGWIEACADLRDQGLTAPTFDEWLTEQGIDPVLYHRWWDERYDMQMISYEEWLALQ